MWTGILIAGILLLLGVVIVSIVVIARDKKKRENSKEKPEVKHGEKDEKTKPSGGEDIPKGSWRASVSKMSGSALGWFVAVIAVGLSVWLFSRHMYREEPPIDDPIAVLSSSEQFERIGSFVTQPSKFEPVWNHVPSWYNDAKYKGRREFSTGPYMTIMKIGEDGEEFEYGPGNRRAFTNAELQASWIKSVPNGARKKGFGYFLIRR